MVKSLICIWQRFIPCWQRTYYVEYVNRMGATSWVWFDCLFASTFLFCFLSNPPCIIPHSTMTERSLGIPFSVNRSARFPWCRRWKAVQCRSITHGFRQFDCHISLYKLKDILQITYSAYTHWRYKSIHAFKLVKSVHLNVTLHDRVWTGRGWFTFVYHSDVITRTPEEHRTDLKLVTSVLLRKNAASNTVYTACLNCCDLEWSRGRMEGISRQSHHIPTGYMASIRFSENIVLFISRSVQQLVM